MNIFSRIKQILTLPPFHPVGDPKKQLLFIVNPKAGRSKATAAIDAIERHLNRKKFDFEIVFTQKAGDATQLTHDAIDASVDAIIAVGGDGTVSEVAQPLVHTSLPMGIIPTGSGNGLAREMGISRLPTKAVKQINRFRTRTIDTIQVGNKYCCVTAGVGFDAHLSAVFAEFGKRGPTAYLQLILKEIQKYKPQHYRLTTDTQTIDQDAFILTLANARQYGNNAYIAPTAKIDDGQMELCIIDPFNPLIGPEIFFELFNKQIHYNEHYNALRCTTLTLHSPPTVTLHIDGDPFTLQTPIQFTCIPHSLTLLH